MWPGDRKSGRWCFPSAVIYGAARPRAGRRCPGNGLGWLQAASSAWREQCCLENRPGCAGPHCVPREPLFAARGCLSDRRVAFPPAGKGQPLWFPGCPRAPGAGWCTGPPPPSCPVPCQRLRVPVMSLLLCVARGWIRQGASGIYSCLKILWRRGHWGGIPSCGGRKEPAWAVAGCNCNGLRETPGGCFLLALYPEP